MFNILFTAPARGLAVPACLGSAAFYRSGTEYDGRLCFHRCLSVNGGGEGVSQSAYPLPSYLLPW